MEVIGDYEIPDSWTAKGMNLNNAVGPARIRARGQLRYLG